MSFRRYYIWRAEDEVRISSLLAPLSALDHPQRQPCLLTHPCSLRCQCRCRCTAVINATTLAAGRPSAACATFATSDATTLAALAASHLHPHVYVVAINGPAQLMSASGAGRPSASRHLRPQVLGKYETPAQHASAHHDAPLPPQVLGKPLKYETLAGVRTRMASIAPQLADATGDAVEPSSPALAKLALEFVPPGAPALLKSALVSPMTNFYMTDPVSRASATMAKCVQAYGTRA